MALRRFNDSQLPGLNLRQTSCYQQFAKHTESYAEEELHKNQNSGQSQEFSSQSLTTPEEDEELNNVEANYQGYDLDLDTGE